MNWVTNWPPAAVAALGGIVGLLVGALNYRLVAGPYRQLARAGGAGDRAAILQQRILFRYLLRMVLSFVSLLVVFLVVGQPMAIIATLVGLILASDIPLFFLMRARRERS
ncbi:MAG TPA: hypothetical protein VIK92_05565 [Thermaerobacter sp.]